MIETDVSQKPEKTVLKDRAEQHSEKLTGITW
jgi:hypothetical protein